ncbi:MAG: hypothetical protein L7F78_27195, partial [Syntrophales bacterium LBB04]|nr:hypothetical protein [Syntrophales bacterium LBB04]
MGLDRKKKQKKHLTCLCIKPIWSIMNRTQYTVKIARNVEEIQQLGSTWESLQWHPNASLHYFLRLLEIRPSIERPHVTMLLECGKPRALLVGRIERAPFHINIGYRTIWSPSMRFLNINYGGVLGDVSLPCSDILIAELIEVIKRGEADIVYLNHLNINSPLYSSAITIPSIVCRDHSPVRNMHWQIILPDTIERVYETLPTKRRHELR